MELYNPTMKANAPSQQQPHPATAAPAMNIPTSSAAQPSFAKSHVASSTPASDTRFSGHYGYDQGFSTPFPASYSSSYGNALTTSQQHAPLSSSALNHPYALAEVAALAAEPSDSLSLIKSQQDEALPYVHSPFFASKSHIPLPAKTFQRCFLHMKTGLDECVSLWCVFVRSRFMSLVVGHFEAN